MLPIRDTLQTKTFPIITVILIIVNISVFLYEISLGNEIEAFMESAGLVPKRCFQFALFGRGEYPNCYMSVLYSLFIHGGWIHLLGNMLFLKIFGDDVEDRLGHFKFLFFYLACGAGGSFLHLLTHPFSPIPIVGASGAIAGVMAAYLLLFPRAKIVTFIPIFIIPFFVDIPAFIFLGYWFFIQLFRGFLSVGSNFTQSGGVGWWAHIGGFVTGILFIKRFFRLSKSS
ncbi:MAG: rhomboid family intramembrane serine protease [bacterium]